VVAPAEVAKNLEGAVGAPVVHEDQLVPEVHAAEGGAELLMEILEGLLLVEEGDDDAEIKAA
jgi:hypothetical protein